MHQNPCLASVPAAASLGLVRFLKALRQALLVPLSLSGRKQSLPLRLLCPAWDEGHFSRICGASGGGLCCQVSERMGACSLCSEALLGYRFLGMTVVIQLLCV